MCTAVDEDQREEGGQEQEGDDVGETDGPVRDAPEGDERLADTGEAAKLNFRFVLGLILMRKRLVVYEDARHDDLGDRGARDVWVVRMKGRDERLDLTDPKLNEQQVAEVSQQLGEILNQEM